MAWRWFMEVPPVAPGINSAANCINVDVLIGGVSYALLGAPDSAVLVIKRELLLLTKGVLFAGAIQCFLIRFHAA